MSKLTGYIYDIIMGPFERKKLHRIRYNLLSKAAGKVLEIGSGTGVNFPYYKEVTVTALEPDESMRERSLAKSKQSRASIEVRNGDAQELEFEDNTFDTVVGTLVLCTIPNPRQALKEIRRVCKPNGLILLFEHVRLEKGITAKAQDILNPIWRKISGGCNLNRETISLLREEGLVLTEVNEYLKGIFLSIEAVNQKDEKIISV